MAQAKSPTTTEARTEIKAATKRLTNLDPEVFTDLHEHSSHYRFGRRKNHELLKEWGHPQAAEYEALFLFLQSLALNANDNARYYSYGGDNETVEAWAPHIGNRDVHMYQLHTDPDEFEASYQRQLDNLDPETADTTFSAGDWIITTESEEFFEAFYEIVEQEMERHVQSVSAPSWSDYNRRPSNRVTDHFSGRIFCQSFDEMVRMKQFFDEWTTPLHDVEIPDPSEVEL